MPRPGRGPRSGALEERTFHRWLRSNLPAGRSGLLPLGDDAAALPVGRNRSVLLSSDALIEGVHFWRRSPPILVGEAAAAVNLSDIAAKGGRPAALLIDVLVPEGTAESWARSVLRGVERMGQRFGCHVVGGDTKPSRTRTVVGVSVGWGGRGRLARRGGARVGDVVITTGVVGFGGANRGNITQSLRIQPRIREGLVLAPSVHSMTDTSDGIADAAHLVAEASGRRVVLEESRLPFHPDLLRGRVSRSGRLARAFYGGDYELFATAPSPRIPALRARLRRMKCPLTVIGRVERGSGAWLDRGGRLRPLPRAGWRHFG